MQRTSRTPRTIIPLCLALLAGSGCGESAAPACGNGMVESGEQCDDGPRNGAPGDPCGRDCKPAGAATPSLTVKWSLLKQAGIPDFMGTDCDAIGALAAHVILTGPARFEETLDCKRLQRTYTALCPASPDGGACDTPMPPGTYQATVTIQRDDVTAITRAITSPPKSVQPGVPVTIAIDFEFDDFLMSFTGSLKLDASWAKETVKCAQAMPSVEKEGLILVANNKTQPAMGMSMQGTPLDGTPGACFTASNATPAEVVSGLPWGPYQLTIEGFAAGAKSPAYCGAFQVFAGPGDMTQIWKPVVPPSVPDGGCP